MTLFKYEEPLRNQFLELFESWIDLKKIFWIKIKIKPIPNSTAERTRKKKVKDSKLRLSNNSPAEGVIRYKVIHKISAVSRRWSELEGLITKLTKIKKKTKKNKFKSPKTKYYKSV